MKYENEKKQFFFLLFRHNYDSEKRTVFWGALGQM